jgi:hypothetical protein
MSFFQLVVLVVSFAVLYKFVIPYLFPSAVSGSGHVIHDVRPRVKKGSDLRAGDEPETEDVSYVIQGSGVPMFGGHRVVAKGDVRRRSAASKADMS